MLSILEEPLIKLSPEEVREKHAELEARLEAAHKAKKALDLEFAKLTISFGELTMRCPHENIKKTWDIIDGAGTQRILIDYCSDCGTRLP